MTMAVDTTGQHQLAARIDFTFAFAELFTERGNAPVVDAEIGGHAVARRHDAAAAYHKVVFFQSTLTFPFRNQYEWAGIDRNMFFRLAVVGRIIRGLTLTAAIVNFGHRVRRRKKGIGPRMPSSYGES